MSSSRTVFKETLIKVNNDDVIVTFTLNKRQFLRFKYVISDGKEEDLKRTGFKYWGRCPTH